MNTLVKLTIIEYLESNSARESGGLICYDLTGRASFEKCENSSNDDKLFKIDFKDYLNIKKSKGIFGIVHSHVDDSVNFSEQDINLSEYYGLPLYLYNTNHKLWKEYWPHNIIHNMTSNIFSWGLFDCYTVVRLYYWKYFKLLLPDFDRDENFISGSFTENIMELAKNEGFSNIFDKERNGDLILLKNYRNAPQHLGIYEDGKIITHKHGSLSSKFPIKDDYFKNKLAALRYNKCNINKV